MSDSQGNLMKVWFYRFTAAHFLLTAISGVFLYFRPLEGRAGWYSEQTKTLLVGLHNGELWSQFILENRYVSGVPIGIVLATTLIIFSVKSIKGKR